MPAVYDPNKDKDEQEQNGQQSGQAPGQGPTQIGGAESAATQGAAPKAPAAVGARKGASSGQFTNIQNYVAGNKQGIAQTGEKVAGKVEGETQTGLGLVSQGAEQTKSAIGATQAAQDKAIGTAITQAQGAANKSATLNEADLSAGLNTGASDTIRNTQFQNLQNIMNQQQKVDELGKAAQSESGKGVLLQEAFKRPQYSRGALDLDTALLSTDPTAIARIQQAGTGTAEVGNQLSAQQAAIEALKGTTTQGLADKQAALKTAIGTGASDVQKGIVGYAQQYQAKLDNITQALQNPRADKVAINSALSSIGIDPNGTTNIPGYGPLDNLTAAKAGLINFSGKSLAGALAAPTTGSNLSQLAATDPAMAARLNILNRLSGQAEIAAPTEQLQLGKGSVNSSILEQAIQRTREPAEAAYKEAQTAWQPTIDSKLSEASSLDTGFGVNDMEAGNVDAQLAAKYGPMWMLLKGGIISQQRRADDLRREAEPLQRQIEAAKPNDAVLKQVALQNLLRSYNKGKG